MNLDLPGTVVAITGGSEGLGRAAARRLAAAGARVAICARRRDVLERSAAQIREATGGEVLAVVADVTSPADCRTFIDRTASHFGGLDVLVNNAGTAAAMPFEEADDALWQDDFDQKFFSAVRCVRAALPHFRSRGGGVVVNVTHVAAKAPPAASLPTVATRAAGLALTKVLSREFAGENIRSNTICVGVVESAQWERARDRSAPGLPMDEWYARRARELNIPLGRFGRAEEFADLVAFLVSRRAEYITGTAINFDGGSGHTL